MIKTSEFLSPFGLRRVRSLSQMLAHLIEPEVVLKTFGDANTKTPAIGVIDVGS